MPMGMHHIPVAQNTGERAAYLWRLQNNLKLRYQGQNVIKRVVVPLTSEIGCPSEEFICFIIDGFVDVCRHVSGNVDVSVDNKMANLFIV